MKKSNVTAPSGYQKPDPMVGKIVRADSFSIPLFNHAKTALIKRFGEDLPPIHYVARPQLKLGGLRFNPNNYAFISNYYFKRLVYFDVKTKKEKEITFPKGSILRETLWSPDGKHLVVSLEKDFDQEVWLVQIPSLKKSKIAGVQLNSVLGRTIEWIGPNRLLMGTRTKGQAKPISLEKRTPTGPVIQDSKGVVSQNRTYPDLIKTPEDEKLFAQAIEQQLVIYDVKTRKKKNLGKPGFFGRISLSPNHQWLLVDTFQLPFSKVVPVSLFAKKTEVWNLSGKVVHAFAPCGPFENLPIEGVQMGPRSIQWIGSEPESLFYAEALDQGDWAVKVDHRDELFKLTITGKGKAKPESIFKMKNRYAGFNYLNEANSYWLTDYERDSQWVMNLWLKKNADQKWEAKTIFSLNENDAYGDPGDPVMTRNSLGNPVIALDERIPGQKAIFLRGGGSSPDGDLPFLRRLDLETLQTEEWFRSEKGAYERFVGFTNDTYSEFITAFESQKESPHYLIRKPNDPKVKVLYADSNPYKVLSQLKKRSDHLHP